VPAGSLPFWQSQQQHSLQLTPGVEVTNFHAYVDTADVAGVAAFRYVWFDVSQPNDSDWVDIVFDTTPGASIAPVGGAGVRTLDVYPNPSLDQVINVRFELENAQGAQELVLHDLTGTEVRRLRVVSGEGNIRIEQGDLDAGVYFLSVRMNGRIVATRRVVFASR
jgi:hypothetical protein